MKYPLLYNLFSAPFADQSHWIRINMRRNSYVNSVIAEVFLNDTFDDDIIFILNKAGLLESINRWLKYDLIFDHQKESLFVRSMLSMLTSGWKTGWKTEPLTNGGSRIHRFIERHELLSHLTNDKSEVYSWISTEEYTPKVMEEDPFLDKIPLALQAEINLYIQTHGIESV